MTKSKKSEDHLSKDGKAILEYYENTIATPEVVDIGPATEIAPRYKGETNVIALREYEIHYPESLIEAYRLGCEQYDQHFMKVVDRHKTKIMVARPFYES